ncbi:MAG: hypothetical protein KBD90_00780 [Alphaproteobacteria bacterium]|nr:hypothetical protein [Alphaproteobacteria bacterium]
MKKVKKYNFIAIWRQWRGSPDFLKNTFVFFMFSIVFVLSIILVWKRYLDKQAVQQQNVSLVNSLLEQQVEQQEAETVTIQKNVISVTERLSALENKIIQQEQVAIVPLKLITVELLKGVLEGLIPLQKFKEFLQKNPEPWAKDFVAPLLPLEECKTYTQLEVLLVSPPLPATQTIWERLLNTLTSLIQIRKLDENGQYDLGQLEDIRKELRAHDIQTALQFFEKLPPQEKTQLASWKQLADARLAVETSAKNLLLELAGG